MNILAHRGFWKSLEEKNSQIAFERAFENGFGVESDFRDCMGRIVISHDAPNGKEMSAEEFFMLYSRFPQAGSLAINIKSDGLAPGFAKYIEGIDPQKYFMFDMSVPDTLGYLKEKIPFLIRVSEYEPESDLLSHSEGIWLDIFNSEWYGMDLVTRFLSLGKKVVLVSPELHRRDYVSLWNRLQNECDINSDLLSLCTDFPDKAKEYFNV